MRWNDRPSQRQTGAAALGGALLMLTLITAITLAAMQAAVAEQRGIANEIRAQAAIALAELAVERGATYVRQNASLISSTAAGGWMAAGSEHWSACSSGEIAPPCGDGRQNRYDANWTAYREVFLVGTAAGTADLHYLARAAASGSAMPSAGVVTLVGDSATDDSSGHTLVQRQVRVYPLIAHHPVAPLMAGGSLLVDGDVSIVPDPDADGHASPLSAWAGGNVSLSGAARSCEPAEFDGACPASGTSTLSDAYAEGIDVLDVDGGHGDNVDTAAFPADALNHVFGLDAAHWPLLRSQAQPLADCASMSAATQGFHWIDHDCSLAAGAVVGSVESPVVLVVENGHFVMTSGSSFHGLVFLLSHGTAVPQIVAGSGALLRGAIAADGDLQISGGPWAVYYRPDIAAQLVQGPAAPMSLAMVPGSWRDY